MFQDITLKIVIIFPPDFYDVVWKCFRAFPGKNTKGGSERKSKFEAPPPEF